MKLISNYLLISILAFGCSHQPDQPVFQGDRDFIGQWYAKDKMLPIDSGIMPVFIYEKAEFKAPRYAEIYIYDLTDEEADSLHQTYPEYLDEKTSILEDAFYLLEHSPINYQITDSAYIVTRDSTVYNKFNAGGYGIMYFTSDNTYIRRGFPDRQEFQAEIDSFFHFVNRIPRPN